MDVVNGDFDGAMWVFNLAADAIFPESHWYVDMEAGD
jgi:hypothetical protein